MTCRLLGKHEWSRHEPYKCDRCGLNHTDPFTKRMAELQEQARKAMRQRDHNLSDHYYQLLYEAMRERRRYAEGRGWERE